METARQSRWDAPRFTTKIDLLAIACLWGLSLIIINPSGDFPLNDDWSMGLAVKRLLETGDFRPTGWTSMPLITQTIWGSLFCIPAGFSFEALRLSTLTLSLLGLLGAYLLIKEVCQSRSLAVIVALTLGFNPIYYALSNTFMTDISFTSINTLALLFFVRHLRHDSDFDLFIGTMLALAATLDRQLGIAIPMAFAISLPLKSGLTNRNLVRAAIPPTLCIGALLVFNQWLAATGRMPALYHSQSETLLHAITNPVFFDVVRRILIALLYLGLFLLPVLIFSLGRIWGCLRNKTSTRLSLSIAVVAIASVTGILWGRDKLMPLSGNIIAAGGIGPLTLRDTYVMCITHLPELPDIVWLVATALSLLGGALLAIVIGVVTIRLLPSVWPGKMNDDQAITTFVLLSGTIYMIPLLLTDFFDRYLIPVMPCLAASIASLSAYSPGIGTRIRPFVAAVLIGLFSVFAICGTRDYLTWNRVRWVALNDLMESKRVSPEDIDGGFEFNGLHLYNPRHDGNPERSWWWVKRDTYLIAFEPVPGYSVMRRYGYSQWMPPHAGSIVLLEKYPK